jgi:hypothetical protein
MVKNLLMQLATSLRLRNGADSCVTDTAEVERRHERRTTDDQYLANIFLGQRCIFVSNEWNDPIVGRVEHIDLSRGVTCHVFDYVHNEPQFFIGFPMHYNEQRLEALLKLNPFERYSLCHASPYYATPIVKPIHTAVLSRAEILQRLRDNGFYEER